MNVRGQALTETLIALLVLIPAFLAVEWLGRWQLLRERAQIATRQALLETFHAGASADPVRAATRARAAFGGVVASDVRTIDVEVASIGEPERVAEIGRTAFGILRPAEWSGAGDFDLPRSAAWSVKTVVAAQRPDALSFVDATLRFESRATILAAPFDAADDDVVLRRVASLSVAGRLREAARWLEPVGAVLAVVEPAFDRFCPGRIDPSVVPADRLFTPSGAPALRDRPC